MKGVRIKSSDKAEHFLLFNSLFFIFFIVITDVIIFNPPSSTNHWMPVLICLCADAACHGLKDGFHYSVVNPQLGKVTVYSTKCT